MKFIYLISIFLMCVSCGESIIKADNSNISYWGRVDFEDPKSPSFEHTGVTIRTRFTGTSISVVMNEHSNGGNYFYKIIDQGEPEKFKVSPGRKVYQLADDLQKGTHTVELIKLTEAFVGRSSFEGFVLDKGAVLKPNEEPKYSVEFIGNSVTCGYGNEVALSDDPGTGYHPVNQNGYTSWGYSAARKLNMRYSAVAYSGKGMYRNYDGDSENTLPDIYDRIYPEHSFPKWDLSLNQPDLIVINLGANDFAQDPSTPLNDEVFISTYVRFVRQLLQIHSKATIICATGVTTNDSYPEGEQHWTRLTNAVKSVVEKVNLSNDERVHYFQMEPQSGPYGEDWHPSALTHERMANQLTDFALSLGLGE